MIKIKRLNKTRIDTDKPCEFFEKWDGMAMMVKDGEMYKRCRNKNTPGFIPATYENKPNYPSSTGWLKESCHELDRYFKCGGKIPSEDGTYELVGEKIQSNKHKINGLKLISHEGAKKEYTTIREAIIDLQNRTDYCEGLIVRQNGEYAKIKNWNDLVLTSKK